MNGLVDLIDTVLRRRAPQLLAGTPNLRLGEVTSVAPLEVILDGETAAVEIDDALTSIVPAVGDRVLVAAQSGDAVLLGAVGATAWQTPTLLNGWENYGASWYGAGYLRDASGFVHLRGLIRNGTAGTAALTLPAGYRTGLGATTNMHYLVRANTGAETLVINGAGDVVPATSPAWQDLASLPPFRAEA